MQLLVSVASLEDAAAALAGGAHIVDAKDPARGALGPVSPAVLASICARVMTARPISAALGEGDDPRRVAREARRCAVAGVSFVKVGFAGIDSARRAADALRGAASSCPVVAVGYADAARVSAIDPFALVDVAARAGAWGVLLDTALKTGPGVRELLSDDALRTWVTAARAAGMRAGIAGRLTAADLPFVRAIDADICGVRGAACDGGRTGRVDSAKVRALIELVGGDRPHVEPRRQRPREERVDDDARGSRGLDEDQARGTQRTGHPRRDAVARHVPRVGQRIRLPQPSRGRQDR
jgi:uncharacterized protein (UPF0264 family)